MSTSPTIKSRLIASISLLSVVLIFLGWLGIESLNENVISIHSIYADRVIPLEQLKTVSDMYAVNIVDTAHKTRNGNLDWEQSYQNIALAERRIHENWTAYLRTDMVGDEKKIIAEALPLMEKADKSILRLKSIVQSHDAKSLSNYTINELYPAIDPITSKIAELVQVQLLVAKKKYDLSHKTYLRNRNVALVAIPFSVILASLIGLALYRSISISIDKTHDHFQKLAAGNLDIDIDISEENELSRLLDSAKAMKSKVENDLKQSRKLANELTRIKVALDNVSTSVMIADNERNIVYTNRSAVQIMKGVAAHYSGHSSSHFFGSLVGANMDIFHKMPFHQAELLQTLNETYKSKISVAGKTFSLTANPVLDEFCHRLGTVVEWEDVTEKLALQQELENQARTDFLTGLANRRYFLELAEQVLLRAQRYSGELSALMIDIDYFKKINDTHGHKAGDKVLQHFAGICKKILREVDIIGRLGGEEFAVILPETSSVLAKDVANRLLNAFNKTSVILDDQVTIIFTASIGVSTLTAQNRSIDQILHQADTALYEAKTSGRNKVIVGS